MPTYAKDYEVYDFLTHADRRVKILVTCPHTVIEHLDTEILANIAIDMPEKGFTVTVKVEEIAAPHKDQPGRRRKRPR